MKIKIVPLLALAVFALSSCKKNDEADQNYRALDGALINATNTTPNFEPDTIPVMGLQSIDVLQRDPQLPDTLIKFSLGASFNRPGTAPFDIPLNYSLDYHNIERLTYEMIVLNGGDKVIEKVPEEAISFYNSDTYIRKGNNQIKKDEEPYFTINPKAILSGHLYYVPFRLTSTYNNYPVNTKQDFVYYLISGVNRPKWTVIGFDSEEKYGEGPTDGQAIFAIDQNPLTSWFSEWTGKKAELPHYITIDMGESTVNFNGVSVTHQKKWTDGNVRKVLIEISQDNIKWETIGIFDNIPSSPLKQDLKFAKEYTARYLKLIVLNTAGNAYYSGIAEIDILKD